MRGSQLSFWSIIRFINPHNSSHIYGINIRSNTLATTFRESITAFMDRNRNIIMCSFFVCFHFFLNNYESLLSEFYEYLLLLVIIIHRYVCKQQTANLFDFYYIISKVCHLFWVLTVNTLQSQSNQENILWKPDIQYNCIPLIITFILYLLDYIQICS